MAKIKKIDFIPKWLLVMVAIFLGLAVVLVTTALVYKMTYRNKIYYGARVGSLDLSGKSKEQAKVLVQAKADKLIDGGVEFYFKDNKFKLEPVISTGSSAYELWLYNPDKIVDQLYGLGRSKDLLDNWKRLIELFLGGSSGKVDYRLKEIGRASCRERV